MEQFARSPDVETLERTQYADIDVTTAHRRERVGLVDVLKPRRAP
jgi:hypothetical protein